MKKRRYGRFILLVLIATFFCFRYKPLDKLKHSSYFQIGHINIYGVENVVIDKVRAKLKVKTGDNIFYFNREESINSLLDIKWIENVSIRTVIPNKLEVKIVEREPIGYLGSGKNILFDKNGVLFKNSLKKDFFLPHIKKMFKEAISEDELLEFLELLQAVEQVGFGNKIEEAGNWEVMFVKNKGIILNTKKYRFLLGRDNYYSKLVEFMRIAPNQSEEPVKNQTIPVNIDLRFDKRVIISGEERFTGRA